MNQNLQDFISVLQAAEKKVAAKGKIKPEHTQMVSAITKQPVMANAFTGEPVFALRIFERRVRRLYWRTEGKPLTKWVPIGVIVLFVVMHWSQIMAVLAAILNFLSWRKQYES
jgi:hypothetical protein